MRARTLTLAAALLLGALTTPATPAQATGGGHTKTPCKTTTHTDTDGWTTAAGGTVTLHTSKGAVVKTGADNADKTTWTRTVTPTALKDLKQLSYQTEKLPGDTNPVALPGYFLRIDVNDDGTPDTTLMYEPYYQVTGNPSGSTTTWDVDAGKWWSNSPSSAAFMTSWADNEKAGGSYAGNETLAQIRGFWPEAKVVGFGINLGTYNVNVHARVNDVTFAGGRVCETHGWKPAPLKPEIVVTPGTCASLGTVVVVKVPAGLTGVVVKYGDVKQTVEPGTGLAPVTILRGDLTVWVGKRLVKKVVHTPPTACPTATPTATGSPSPTAMASPSPTGTPSTPATASASPSSSSVVLVPAGGDQLPKTGSTPLLVALVGLLVVAAGAVLVLARGRRSRFEA